MKALCVNSHVSHIEKIDLTTVELPIPTHNADECLIKIAACGINPSDALATLGYFQHATVPRIPGRDFSGTVVAGPHHLVGLDIWGTGGAAGISFDGTHAEYIILPVSAIATIPTTLDLLTASAQTLPYVTAYYSLVKRAAIKPGESVLIVGALGQVGHAAMSICQWQDCPAIAAVRGKEAVIRATELGWNTIDTEAPDLYERILAANNRKPVNVILNSVGNIYWPAFIKALAAFGRLITMGAREQMREVNINLFDLYRANQDLIGINSVALDFTMNAELLNELRIGFEENKLTPLTAQPNTTYSFEEACNAYQHVLNNPLKNRIVVKIREDL